jgi:hypothetical protein
MQFHYGHLFVEQINFCIVISVNIASRADPHKKHHDCQILTDSSEFLLYAYIL